MSGSKLVGRAGWRLTLGVFATLCALGGCREKAEGRKSAAPGSPYSKKQIEAVNNPKHLDDYDGPLGAVEGVVTVAGDLPPALSELSQKIPPQCEGARTMYSHLFREGSGRTLADALVAVTGYRGHLKTPTQPILVQGQGCAWQTRTIALTFGQWLTVKSADKEAYVPDLLGSSTGATLVAVPGGDAVPLAPKSMGHFVLIDSMRIYSKADVFVLQYPTHDVTRLDGRYRISGIPVGRITVSALLPAINKTAQQQVDVVADTVVRCDLTIQFDAAEYARKVPPDASATPAPATPKTAGSVAPAPASAQTP